MALLVGPPPLLFALPDTCLREVVSWIPNSRSANALLNTCSAGVQLRTDSTAVALLLLRMPHPSYKALITCSCAVRGWNHEVMQQVLRLMGATSAAGGPITAPPALLEAMLQCMAGNGDTDGVRTLMALPHPPNPDAGDGAALLLAVQFGPHLDAMQVLLECGANPCAFDGNIIEAAAKRRLGSLPTLQLLLQHCSDEMRPRAAGAALEHAILAENLHTLAYALTLARPGKKPSLRHIVETGQTAILELVFQHRTYSVARLNKSLQTAAAKGMTPIVKLLLDQGADVHHAGDLLLRSAVQECRWCINMPVSCPKAFKTRLQTVALLLQRGSVVTQAVLAAGAGDPAVLAMLHQAELDVGA